MGLIRRIRAIFSTRWLVPVLVGVTATLGGVFVYGYMTGYDRAEDLYQRRMNESLAAQYERLLAMKENEERLAIEVLEERYGVQQRVNEVPQPAADSCTLSDECMQWYDDILRASTTDIESANP